MSAQCSSALGLEDLKIQDSQLTAQSHYESLSIGGGISVDTEPKCARLNKNNCAWCAPRGNGQYLQVDLRRDVKITGIATQGFEALSDYYVKRYKVSHSRDGYTWSTFPQVMRGNRDGGSVVRHTFSSPKYVRYIRVYPMTYRYRICMRMELYGCTNSSSALSTTPSATTTLSGANNETPKNVPPTTRTTAAPSTGKPMISHSASGCNTALGLEDLRIQDSQLTAQSYYESLSIGGGISVDTEPKYARLNKNNCAWCAPRGDGQYLQVDLRHDVKITGIATQGLEALSDYYVTRYKVSHSRDGHTWSILPELIRGNHDGRSVVRHTFSSPMYARYIRVYPMAYRYRICMRIELYGCSNSSSVLSSTPSPTNESGSNSTTAENVPPTIKTTAAASTGKPMMIHSTTECNSALGLEDLRIQDSQLTAQSYYERLSIGGGMSVNTEPKCARLNKNNCAWCTPRGNGQYLQVDLIHDFLITGIATQGFEALSDYYVRRYKVSLSRNGHTWSILSQVMRGNHDGTSVVSHTFIPPVYARYIRVYPMAYRYRICMRMELYGCLNSSSALSTAPSATTLSGANSTTPENVPSTTRTTAASSTEKPTMIHSTTASSVLSTTPSPTKESGANDTTPENAPPTTRKTAASSTEKPMIIHSTTECDTALGLENLRIKDSQLSGHSYYQSLSAGADRAVETHPRCARLNNNYCAWCGRRGNGQYIQVDLRQNLTLTGIATQGFEALSDYYVRRYNVSHSTDGYTWSIFPKVMRGNHDGRSMVRHTFNPPMHTRYIRVYPIAYSNIFCMRMELYGCSNCKLLITLPSLF
ncbi:uncharacterized protein LOC122964956 [Acropora millepora]|uniref:uncharacterized protein LOC122964956 n=1 Tax=Acropora millepora TaxID=45264 RepID=UPI001CF5473A|nr:uncharacterized protein LOC122964956 [Acropora millepora]